MKRRASGRPHRRRGRQDEILRLDGSASLLEVVDHLLGKGVRLDGDIVLALAGVDLVYLRLGALLCAVERLARERPVSPGGAGPRPRRASAGSEVARTLSRRPRR